jgi:hypothetical protein
LRLGRRRLAGPRVLDGFVDSVVQSFENCRPGLPDEASAPSAGPFFAELYERETPRLLEAIRTEEPHLSPEARAEYARAVDALIRKVLLPAYVRVASRFTAAERNGFYRLPEPLHALERVLLCAAGVAVGAFAVWAPFIPLWEKGWVLPFAFAGLFVPELRRWLAVRRYERDLNALVIAADTEIARLDMAYLTSPEALGERAAREARRAPDAGRVAN